MGAQPSRHMSISYHHQKEKDLLIINGLIVERVYSRSFDFKGVAQVVEFVRQARA